jgi:uncharacterized protein involved in response to NO
MERILSAIIQGRGGAMQIELKGEHSQGVEPRHRPVGAWPLLSAGFRPFFLAAGLWASIAMVFWILMLQGAIVLPTAFDPVAWHFHELIFGFVVAAMAGFLLTAIPNWTGRAPIRGWPLGALVLLWVLGRIAVAVSAWTGPGIAMAIDLSFLVVFAPVAGREIIAGRTWRNLPILVVLALLIAANAMIHVGALNAPAWEVAGKRLAISTVVMLISLIGGRIIPNFTANWLRRRDMDASPVAFGPIDKGALAISVVALAAWMINGLSAVTGVVLIMAGMLHGVRLARWRGGATLREPLLWILHLGYLWLPAGFVLLGLAAWRPGLATIAIHAFTVGAMGTMILAVMTRASLGHSNRALTAGYGTLAVYVLVLVATVARLVAPVLGAGQAVALDMAGGAWVAAFALFVVLYLPLYVRR